MSLVGSEERLAQRQFVNDALLVDVVSDLLEEQGRAVEHGDSAVARLQRPASHPGWLFGQLDLVFVDRVRTVRRSAAHDVHHSRRVGVVLGVLRGTVMHDLVVEDRVHLDVPVLVAAQVQIDCGTENAEISRCANEASFRRGRTIADWLEPKAHLRCR